MNALMQKEDHSFDVGERLPRIGDEQGAANHRMKISQIAALPAEGQHAQAAVNRAREPALPFGDDGEAGELLLNFRQELRTRRLARLIRHDADPVRRSPVASARPCASWAAGKTLR